MTYISAPTLSFNDFIAQYGDNPRYELIDGELRDINPTGPHETVAGKLAGYLFNEILHQNLPWFIQTNLKSHLHPLELSLVVFVAHQSTASLIDS